MQRYEAYVDQSWRERGITPVVIGRSRDGGWVEYGMFLVDVFCLGVKDAFLGECASVDWESRLDRILPKAERRAIHPACARKLVEGAVAYAEALGIAPHRDFKKARRAFGSVAAKDCPETFAYGQGGMPLFIAGPNDDEERIARVMRLLAVKLGPKGFHYSLPVDRAGADDDPEFDQAPKEALRLKFIGYRREEYLHVLGGLCAAACIANDELMPEDLIPVLWGDWRPTGWTEDDATNLGSAIAEYWNHTEDRFVCVEAGYPPLYLLHFTDERRGDEGEVRVVARLWCDGFMRAVAAWPKIWAEARARPDLTGHFDLIAAVAGDAGAMARVTVPTPDALVSAIGAAVIAVRQAQPPVSEADAD